MSSPEEKKKHINTRYNSGILSFCLCYGYKRNGRSSISIYRSVHQLYRGICDLLQSDAWPCTHMDAWSETAGGEGTVLHCNLIKLIYACVHVNEGSSIRNQDVQEKDNHDEELHVKLVCVRVQKGGGEEESRSAAT